VGAAAEDLVVYYCTDNHSALPDVDSVAITKMDEELTRRADQVFVSSATLLEKKRELNPHVEHAPHGVDVQMFQQASDPDFKEAEAVRGLSRPVIGFFGLIEAWIDLDLIAFLARSRPAWTFLMIGRLAVDPGELGTLPNVTFTGPQPYEMLPRWAKAFDVAIIPYRLTYQVLNAAPLKLREYLATGKPVVAVSTPDIDQFADCVRIARDQETFLNEIEGALRGDSTEAQRKRLAAVGDMSWDARAEKVFQIVEKRAADAITTPNVARNGPNISSYSYSNIPMLSTPKTVHAQRRLRLKDWRLKGIIQKSLSSVPYGQAVNDYLQLTLGELRHFESVVDSKIIDDWVPLTKHLRETCTSIGDRDYLEIGAGWFPTLPICFSLSGARTCRTLDIQPLLKAHLTTRMLHRVEAHLPLIAELSDRPLIAVKHAYNKLLSRRTILDILSEARIEYLSPIDTTDTGLASSSVDAIFSNGVLMLIPTEVLRQIMKECYRLLRPGGIMIHSVACSDQYAYWDPGISKINYLRYTSEQWKFWNTGLLYQNRLRSADYLQLAQSAGFEIVSCKRMIAQDADTISDARQVAEEFQQYSHDELCCTSMDFIAKRP